MKILILLAFGLLNSIPGFASLDAATFRTYYVFAEGIKPENQMCGEILDLFETSYDVVKLDKHTTNSVLYSCDRRMDGKYHYEFELVVEPKNEADIEWVQQYAIDHAKIKINKQTHKLLPVKSIDINTQFWVWSFKLDEPKKPVDKYNHFDILKSVRQPTYASYLQLKQWAERTLALPSPRESTEQISPLFPSSQFMPFVKQELPGMHSFSITLHPVFTLENNKEFLAKTIDTYGFSCLVTLNGPCYLD